MLNGFPKLFNKIPLAAGVAIANAINIVKTLGIAALERVAGTIGPILAKGFKQGQGQVNAAAEAAGQ